MGQNSTKSDLTIGQESWLPAQAKPLRAGQAVELYQHHRTEAVLTTLPL